MVTVTIELPRELYDRLCQEAERQGKSPQELAQQWVIERLMALDPVPTDELEEG
jgi:hypothetical protein